MVLQNGVNKCFAIINIEAREAKRDKKTTQGTKKMKKNEEKLKTRNMNNILLPLLCIVCAVVLLIAYLGVCLRITRPLWCRHCNVSLAFTTAFNDNHLNANAIGFLLSLYYFVHNRERERDTLVKKDASDFWCYDTFFFVPNMFLCHGMEPVVFFSFPHPMMLSSNDMVSCHANRFARNLNLVNSNKFY